MIIYGQCPTRLSLFGGGTDLPKYSQKYNGICINFAINIRQKLTAYFNNDIWQFNNGKGGNNIFPIGADPNFYYKILKNFGLNDMHQIKFKSEFDGIIESGIGSSASVAVLLIGVINKYLNLNMTLSEIAEKAWDLEVNTLNLYGGRQDQNAASFGGANIMEFSHRGVIVIPIERKLIEELLPSLCLFYTGSNRQSAKIQEGFKKLSEQQIKILDQIKQLASLAIEPIKKGDVDTIGELLNEAWEYKRLSNKGVTNPKIDNIYTHAIKYGALGGKIMGAGGGGFMLFIVPDKKEEFIANMEKLDGVKWWDFSLDFQGLDVRILPE